jgi:hypothetical protein
MISTDVVAKIRPSTCAVVRLKRPHEELVPSPSGDISLPDSDVIATGFLIRRDLVLTNRHVVQEIVTASKKAKSLKHWYVLFTYPIPGGKLSQTYRRLTNVFAFVEPSGGDRLDAGILAFNRSDDFAESHCPPVQFAELSSIAVGVEIGICGFPLGNAVTSRAPAVTRFGPLIHEGIISGLAPFDVRNPRGIITFLTDLNTAGGMSGSPVFLRSDGNVLGLHFAGAAGTLGCAIPIDRARVEQWIAFYEKVAIRNEPVSSITITGGGDIPA